MAQAILGHRQAMLSAKAVDGRSRFGVEFRQLGLVDPVGKLGQLRPQQFECEKHPLQFDHVRPAHDREPAIAEPLVNGIILATQFGDRLRMLGDLQCLEDVIPEMPG